MFSIKDQAELETRYRKIAAAKQSITSDLILRDLEMKTALRYLDHAESLLDVGCGYGETTGFYQFHVQNVIGIDICEEAVEKARTKHSCTFAVASVLDLSRFRDFDVVTSHRCLMSLLDWEMQKEAIKQIYNALCPGGKLIMFEGFESGLKGLNRIRKSFALPEIPGDGRNRLMTLRFDDYDFRRFTGALFRSFDYLGFDLYYLLTRVYYPLIIYPEEPRYNTVYHEIAAQVQEIEQIQDTNQISLETCIVLRK